MKIRILCLHDKSSSALSLIKDLKKVGKLLQEKHNIELAFVNSPHIMTGSNMNANMNANMDTNNNDSDDLDEMERVWYYNERQLGLDASILHLRQIWTQSLYSNPFSGILGIGQGASVAALLPFLSFEQPLTKDDEFDSEGDGEGDIDIGGDNHGDTCSVGDYKAMFEGLQFCIFVNGWDLINDRQPNQRQRFNQQQHEVEVEPEYDEASNLPSLHIYQQGDDDDDQDTNQSKSHRLYKRYGGVGSRNENTGPSKTSSKAQKYLYNNFDNENKPTKCTGTGTPKKYLDANAMNAIGKFLVQQKKNIHADISTTCAIINDPLIENSSAGDGNTGTGAGTRITKENTDDALADIEATRKKLARVEQKSLELIHKSISENPPKALMAMIMPDQEGKRNGTIVGGWSGERDAFRSEGFINSGGAPCPKDFLLSEEERKMENDQKEQGQMKSKSKSKSNQAMYR